VLVTGAGGGIGLATASAFGQAGASVIVADSNAPLLEIAADGLRSAGHQVLAVNCDVTDRGQVKAMIEQVVKTFGRLDAAFNNAGINCDGATWRAGLDFFGGRRRGGRHRASIALPPAADDAHRRLRHRARGAVDAGCWHWTLGHRRDRLAPDGCAAGGLLARHRNWQLLCTPRAGSGAAAGARRNSGPGSRQPRKPRAAFVVLEYCSLRPERRPLTKRVHGQHPVKPALR
jgi:short chain dehydrogenase